MSFCKKHKYKLIFAIVAILVVVLCIVYYFVLKRNIEDISNRGSFGDMFGAVGALFSGLAFAGVIVTMLQQKEELELQRQELSQTNKELELQREEMKEQNKTLMLQRFENAFFIMLRQQQEFLQLIKYTETSKSKGSQTTEGRSAIRNLYDTLEVLMEGDLFYRQNPNADFGTILDNGQMWNNFSAQLEHYFRHVYQILKFIDDSQYLTEKEKYSYSCILRSQLSPHELLMLFYFGITREGKVSFKSLVEKYALMQNLKKDLLMDVSHYDYYAPEAYSHQGIKDDVK